MQGLKQAGKVFGIEINQFEENLRIPTYTIIYADIRHSGAIVFTYTLVYLIEVDAVTILRGCTLNKLRFGDCFVEIKIPSEKQ